jgi:uncharacterized repeat protein (TIGR04076 family)
LQAQYCANPESGACSCYNVGDEFIFERYGNADDFWHMGINTLKQSVKTADAIADIFIQVCRAVPLCRDG